MGPDGWAGGTSRWREALDSAAQSGSVGEIALTLRAAATTAMALGEHDVAHDLAALAPRSTAITVLPELFPEAAADLAEHGPRPRSSRHLVDALAVARTLLGPTQPVRSVAPSIDGHAVTRAGELARDGDGWRITFDGRSTRIRDMKGIADLAMLVTRPGREVHALELMGGQDVGGTAGPALDERARRTLPGPHRRTAARDRRGPRRQRRPAGRAGRARAGRARRAAQRGVRAGGSRTFDGIERRAGAHCGDVPHPRRDPASSSDLHPELGRHLANAVRTGTWCSYQPETEVHWTVVERPTVTCLTL